MTEFFTLVSGQLFKLFVLWPAWALTPEGRKALVSWKVARRILAFVVIAVVVLGMAQMLPADLAFLYATDVATWFDLAAVAWLLGLAGRLKDLVQGAATLVSLVRPRRAPRSRPRTLRSRRPARPPAADNEDEPVLRAA
jgi:hypothetical protein